MLLGFPIGIGLAMLMAVVEPHPPFPGLIGVAGDPLASALTTIGR